MTISRFIASAVLLLSSAQLHAFEFKTVAPNVAILYDAPSTKGGKLFVAPRGMPVQVVLTYGDWVKVRDATGDLAWLEQRSLSARRNVVVRTPNAKVRAAADDAAPLLMTADKGVVLELLDPQPASWIRVRHRDGITGYIKMVDAWGI
ncbi:SH3 domain-containing protein [Massilia sp. RP-1-19]|uniref:SH3 domain-containing protein n=1 Tax=Massilia polaris TaxID=2728846 RepID=A0A848HK10_9BURK|nr:SH3 domain-containing protein [Massilia polaris]NML60281.1 SH3 domain-containing protein [Massilia polaris]